VFSSHRTLPQVRFVSASTPQDCFMNAIWHKNIVKF